MEAAVPEAAAAAEPADSMAQQITATLSELSELGPSGMAQVFHPEEVEGGLRGASDDEGGYLEPDGDGYEQLEFFDALEPPVRERLRGFIEHALLAPRRRLLRHKVTFTLATLLSFLAAYWLGASPETFHRLYTVQAVALFSIRWAAYRWQKWHYYLFDFCYFANVLLLVQLWAFPVSVRLIKICFAFNCGPLIWSIIAFRNSLVFHSIDKMSSHYMHWFPALVSWATRWQPPPVLRERLQASPELAAQWEASGLWDLAALPMIPYLLWALLYYLKIFVVSSKRIQERGYQTLFAYVTSKRGLYATAVLRSPKRLQPLAYMAVHVGLTAAALAVNSLWWRSKAAHTVFLFGVFAQSAWSGASFYFDWFAHKYLAGLGLEPGRVATPREEAGHGGGAGGRGGTGRAPSQSPSINSLPQAVGSRPGSAAKKHL